MFWRERVQCLDHMSVLWNICSHMDHVMINAYVCVCVHYPVWLLVASFNTSRPISPACHWRDTAGSPSGGTSHIIPLIPSMSTCFPFTGKEGGVWWGSFHQCKCGYRRDSHRRLFFAPEGVRTSCYSHTLTPTHIPSKIKQCDILSLFFEEIWTQDWAIQMEGGAKTDITFTMIFVLLKVSDPLEFQWYMARF